MTSSSARWQAPDASTLLRRHWAGEDEHVVFNAASGDLHLLNPAAMAVLDRLSQGPASLDELSAALNIDVEALSTHIQSLDRLGLIGPLLS
jgi:PqqD family protein of HPr-rel-A system